MTPDMRRLVRTVVFGEQVKVGEAYVSIYRSTSGKFRLVIEAPESVKILRNLESVGKE